MRFRPVLMSTLAVALVAGTSALAAPAKVCKLVTDAEGDGRHRLTGLASPALDILSADVATGKKEVVGIIRLKTTDTTGDPLAYLEMSWSLSFQMLGKTYAFGASRRATPTGSVHTFGGTFDATTITWRASRKDFEPLVKKPGKVHIESISAMSHAAGGSADSAFGAPNTKYLDFTPSCLKAN